MSNNRKKTFLKNQLHHIQGLSASELDAHLQDMYIRNLPDDVMRYLNKAVEIRRDELLNTLATENTMAIHSELTLQDI